jgi:AcrR family transcriptional regulator
MGEKQIAANESKAKKGTRNRALKDAEATRSRIFNSARIRFSHTSYEAVGIREIAGDAGVDPALVMRYFGSKENLFREIAASAFASVDILQGDSALFAERILQELLRRDDDKDWRLGYDPFRLLLCSVSSEVAGPIISQAFHRSFVEVLARSLQGRLKVARAALVASYVLGVALLRVMEPQATFEGKSGNFIRKQLSEALDHCFAPVAESD